MKTERGEVRMVNFQPTKGAEIEKFDLQLL